MHLSNTRAVTHHRTICIGQKNTSQGRKPLRKTQFQAGSNFQRTKHFESEEDEPRSLKVELKSETLVKIKYAGFRCRLCRKTV